MNLKIQNDKYKNEISNMKKDFLAYGMSPINTWDTSLITDMSLLFKNNRKRINSEDTINIDNFNYDISNWNVSNVTDMSYMFDGLSSFNIDISKWNVLNVRDMSYMFKKCIFI